MLRRLLLWLFSHHTLYLLRIDLHFLGIRLQNLILRRRPGRIKTTARYLNLACGSLGKQNPDWFNLDGWPSKGVDYTTDLRRRLPFPDQRFAGVFCEHFFEHLTPHDRGTFLRECLRVLQPGGTLRISVPDGALYLDKYFTDRAWMTQRRGGGKVPMVIVNEVFRQGYQHEYCYDAETLTQCLSDAGFTGVKVEKYKSGGDKNLLIDQAERSFESLYVEGRSP